MERVWQRMVGAQSEQDEREASRIVHRVKGRWFNESKNRFPWEGCLSRKDRKHTLGCTFSLPSYLYILTYIRQSYISTYIQQKTCTSYIHHIRLVAGKVDPKGPPGPVRSQIDSWPSRAGREDSRRGSQESLISSSLMALGSEEPALWSEEPASERESKC